jgi:hypothetical protein
VARNSPRTSTRLGRCPPGEGVIAIYLNRGIA